MIGDVPWQGLLQDVEDYERKMPDSYLDLRDTIKHVKNVMRELQRELDAPPMDWLVCAVKPSRKSASGRSH